MKKGYDKTNRFITASFGLNGLSFFAASGCAGLKPAVWTGSSQNTVSSLAFELRKDREFQKTSCAVRTENHRSYTTTTAGFIPHNLRLM